MSTFKPHVSAALGRIQPSATLAMTARVTKLKAEGVDVIGLSAGEPDFDTPDFVKEAAIEAIRNGQTKSTLVDGTVALKDAIRGKFRRDNRSEAQTTEPQSLMRISYAVLCLKKKTN